MNQKCLYETGQERSYHKDLRHLMMISLRDLKKTSCLFVCLKCICSNFRFCHIFKCFFFTVNIFGLPVWQILLTAKVLRKIANKIIKLFYFERFSFSRTILTVSVTYIVKVPRVILII